MTSFDVVAQARSRGLRCSPSTIRRWVKGNYLHPQTGEKTWYFEDHRGLVYTDVKIGIGYEFSPEVVTKWIDDLIAVDKS